MQSWIFVHPTPRRETSILKQKAPWRVKPWDSAFVWYLMPLKPWNRLLFSSLCWTSLLILIRNERKQSCLKMMQMEDLRKPWRVKSIGCVCGRIGEECSDSKGTDRAAAAKGRSPRIQSQHFGIKTLKGRDDKTFEGRISQTAVSTSLKRVN